MVPILSFQTYSLIPRPNPPDSIIHPLLALLTFLVLLPTLRRYLIIFSRSQNLGQTVYRPALHDLLTIFPLSKNSINTFSHNILPLHDHLWLLDLYRRLLPLLTLLYDFNLYDSLFQSSPITSASIAIDESNM